MNSFNTFIDMGGYAAFVWPSYALAIVGLVGVLVLSRRSVATRQAELERLRPRSAATTSEGESVDRVSLDEGTTTHET